jgi:hypothetical protein
VSWFPNEYLARLSPLSYLSHLSCYCCLRLILFIGSNLIVSIVSSTCTSFLLSLSWHPVVYSQYQFGGRNSYGSANLPTRHPTPPCAQLHRAVKHMDRTLQNITQQSDMGSENIRRYKRGEEERALQSRESNPPRKAEEKGNHQRGPFLLISHFFSFEILLLYAGYVYLDALYARRKKGKGKGETAKGKEGKGENQKTPTRTGSGSARTYPARQHSAGKHVHFFLSSNPPLLPPPLGGPLGGGRSNGGRYASRTNRGGAGLRSAARNNKATRLLTRPGHAAKSSAKDLSQRAAKLQSAGQGRRLPRRPRCQPAEVRGLGPIRIRLRRTG